MIKKNKTRSACRKSSTLIFHSLNSLANFPIALVSIQETNEQICDLFRFIKRNIDTIKTIKIKEGNPILRDNNLGG